MIQLTKQLGRLFKYDTVINKVNVKEIVKSYDTITEKIRVTKEILEKIEINLVCNSNFLH